ncbi:MAG: hypothetical protein HYX27_28425 [Acidobacteria bacterium]|nr:hypothetical protein [Acidobacteriota bacterium]
MKPFLGIALLAGLIAGAEPAAVKGERLVFRFVASELANLTFELDAMAGLSGADGKAYRALWEKELRWDREDDRQLDRWKSLRMQQRDGGQRELDRPNVPWPPNYAGFYGQELGLDQSVRIAGFQARSMGDYAKRLQRVVERREADALVSVVKHFGPRFGEFWTREGKGLVAPKAEGFARLVRERGILALAERFVVFTEAQLPRRHGVWFYLMARPTRFGKDTMATQVQSHAPVEMLDEERPEDKLGVIVHELVHHFYDRAPLGRHMALIEEFRGLGQPWRMPAYSYLNEAVATAAGVLVERRLRTGADFVRWAAHPRNVYGQPWIAALGVAAYPLVERCLEGGCGLFTGFAARYVEAVGTALGPRVEHPHFRLASRILVLDNRALRTASRLFRERVPSIMHATGWDQLARFPDVPVVMLAVEGEQANMLERIGPGRDVTILIGATAEAVEREVERFATRPF